MPADRAIAAVDPTARRRQVLVDGEAVTHVPIPRPADVEGGSHLLVVWPDLFGGRPIADTYGPDVETGLWRRESTGSCTPTQLSPGQRVPLGRRVFVTWEAR